MFMEMTRRQWLGRMAAAAAGAASAGVLAGQPTAATRTATRAAPKAPVYPFYAFDNGLNGGDAKTIEDKCKLLRELGYAGISLHLDHKQVPAWLEQLDKNQLELFALYGVPFLEDVFDPNLGETVQRLKGRRTRVELAIRSKLLKPGDAQGDAKAIEYIKRVSDLLGTTGPVASVYPHAGFWTARVEDGLRLAKAVNRKNFGTNFNLVHWKWTGSDKSLQALLADLTPRLFTVTVNGLQSDPPQNDKIVPLNEGDFDVEAFLLTVKQAGYRGLIGLQCFSIPGPSRKHLQASMEKWQKIRPKMEE